MDTNLEHGARENLGRAILWLTRRHHQRCDALLERLGIGSGQVPILMELGHHGALTQRQLAEKVHVTAATMSGTLKRMERAGLIYRTSRAEDARISVVQLTENGRARVEEARAVFQRVDAEMLSGIADESCAVMYDLCGQMLANMDAVLPICCNKGEKP